MKNIFKMMSFALCVQATPIMAQAADPPVPTLLEISIQQPNGEESVEPMDTVAGHYSCKELIEKSLERNAERVFGLAWKPEAHEIERKFLIVSCPGGSGEARYKTCAAAVERPSPANPFGAYRAACSNTEIVIDRKLSPEQVEAQNQQIREAAQKQFPALQRQAREKAGLKSNPATPTLPSVNPTNITQPDNKEATPAPKQHRQRQFWSPEYAHV